MAFLAPYMLLGGLAAAIPIALHFFYRSRYRNVPWAAMKFLLAAIEQTSRRLRFQGHEVTIFHTLHPDEIGFPFEGMTRFIALEEEVKVLTRPQVIRPAYLRALRGYLDELRAGCHASRVDLVTVDTTRPLGQTLAGWLAMRLQMG